MNKNKKIVAAIVSIVMAGTMVGSLAGCGGGGNDDGGKKVTLPISIGNNNNKTGVRYIASQETAMSGKTLAGEVIDGAFKPAWKQLAKDINVTFKDLYNGDSASSQYTAVKDSDAGFAGTAIMTMSATNISTYSKQFLDINQYLEELPNYKAFLESNAVVWASLLDDTDGTTKMLPYFDGNNDIEKYVLVQKAVVEAILDATDVSAATGTFAAQATAKQSADETLTVSGASAAVTAYMGSAATDSWTVPTTAPGGDASVVGYVKLDYGAVITALGDTSTGLGAAVEAVKTAHSISAATPTTSGNIIDIQNFLINQTNGTVTGAELIKVTQEFIKTAYKYSATETGTYAQLYGTTVNSVTTKVSDVFNSVYGAWDVDLYAALGRCFVTSNGLSDLIGAVADTYLYAARTMDTQRGSDVYALAGELYGVRGLDSRYNFSYIGEDGTLKDTRANLKTWQAVANMSGMAKEGLIFTGSGDQIVSNKNLQKNDAGKIEALSLRDFVQTQTAVDFTNEAPNAQPIVTPVSHWDTDDDGDDDTTMRFTESWRGVKDGGLVVSQAWWNKATAEEKEACLKFIDYCYSNDGKKVMTYGSFSSNGNTNPNGTWYGEKFNGTIGGVSVSNGKATLSALKDAGVIDTYDGEQYFVTAAHEAEAFMYGNVLYTGTYYNGRQIPTMTSESLSRFHDVGGNSFTNYAREYLGSTLPAFEKDQGFEFQCTSDSGREGALIVADALVNGTIKHPFQTLDGTNANGEDLDTMWYTLVPTLLPYTTDQKTTIGTENYNYFSGTASTAFWFNAKGGGNTSANYFLSVIYYGVGYIDGTTSGVKATTAQNLLDVMKYIRSGSTETDYIAAYAGIKDNAWQKLLTWYAEQSAEEAA